MARSTRAQRFGTGEMLVPALVALLALAACTRGTTSSRPPIHINPNMLEQPRYDPQAASAFFYDGAAMRPPVPGTVARGELRDDGPFWTGRDAAGAFVTANPLPIDDAVRRRGARRYDIYCAPCHDARGDGKGILFERGKVPTATFHSDRLRQMADGELFDTVTNGKGLMPAYRYPIPVADRWAILAHVRRLQAERLARSGGVDPTGAAAAAPPPPAPPRAPPPTPPRPPRRRSGCSGRS